MVSKASLNESDTQDIQVHTLILADDHPIVRTALKNEFEKEQGFRIIAEASDGEQVIELVENLKPNIVVMDIGMPKKSGIEATRQIKARYPDIIVLVLTIYDDIEHILGVLESGADGYLTKTVLIEDIVHSVKLMVAGETVLSPHIFQQVLKYALRYNTKAVTLNTETKLTVRELEVLKLVALGLSNKNIAEKLQLGTRTVKSHLVDIFYKLNAFSRTEAVITGLRAGFLKLEDLG